MTERHTSSAPANKHSLPPAGNARQRAGRIPTDAQLGALLADRMKHRPPPQEPEPLSEAELRGAMARLRARGAFDDPKAMSEPPRTMAARQRAKPATAPAGGWQRALAWLGLQQNEALGARWVATAAAVLGVAVVVFYPAPPDPADVDMDTTKDVSGLQIGRGLTPAEASSIRTAQPAADAAQLAHELAAAGATAITVRGDGQDRIVRATVPGAAASAVGQVLSGWGLAPRVGSNVEVRLAGLPG